MGSRRRLGDQQVRELVEALRDLRWSWTSKDIDWLIDEFGWTVEYRDEAIVELDIGVGTKSGELVLDDHGGVETISVDLCSRIDRRSAAERWWLQDLFAEAVGLVGQVLGEPTRRRPGAIPEVRWRRSRETLGVVHYSVVVGLFLTPNHWLDFAERYGESDDDD
ncbi:DUF6301 family protein [Actinomadura fibrosa]|uniref:DUF6301 family protein n=1 Tax=Actinomadura fibrosa TaxID=111802 RepID=A0ABW2Y253_9ACTN